MKRNVFLVSVLLTVFICAGFSQSAKLDALELYSKGDYKEAISVCEQEIAANPNNMNSYTVLCWALVANKQYAEAEQIATEARKINSYDLRIIEVLGEAKYYLGKNNEALNLFERFVANATESTNRFARVYYYMGEIYIKQKKYEHADIAFSTATRTEPLRDFWWSRLGYAREMTGDYMNALVAYEKALSLNPSQWEAGRGKSRCQSHLQ